MSRAAGECGRAAQKPSAVPDEPEITRTSLSGKREGYEKVLGASVSGILRQVNKEFLGPILLSNLIAWPVGYVAMKTWLRGFAHRTNLSLSLFVTAAGAALAIALITVSFQSVKAALENPARSLKNK